MTNRDAGRFAAVMAALSETFNEPVSDARAETYFQALEDLLIDDVELAARNHIRVGRFFPKPVELREWVTGTDEDQSLEAWQQLVGEVRRTGYTGRPTLPAATREVVDRLWGSWVALCEVLPADGPGFAAWEKRFRETYEVVATRQRQALADAPTRPQLVE